VLNALIKYNYIKDEQSTVNIELAEVSSNNNNSKSNELGNNYFKNVIKDAANLQGGDSNLNHAADVEVTHLLGRVKKKKRYLNSNEPSERLSPTRDVMEKIAADHQKKQAVAVNKNRAKVTKPVLEVGDVGSIKVQGNTKGATDHPWLPIMVTVVRQISDSNYMYTLCTQHGYLSGEFSRGDIYQNDYMTAKNFKN
jgi:hypothetical protein